MLAGIERSASGPESYNTGSRRDGVRNVLGLRGNRTSVARDFRPVVADEILVAATRKLGERNDRKSFGEADRVGEQLRNVLPPWWSFVLLTSSSPNTFRLRRVKRFPVPLTSVAFAGVMHFRISLQ